MRLLLIMVTSLLMAVEAGEYYAGFYGAQAWRGYALAGLAEVFLVLALAVRLPGRPWLRLGFRATGGLLFLVVVLGASARDASKGWEQWQGHVVQEQQIQRLERIVESRARDIEAVKGQRTNTALSIKGRRAAEDRLMESQDKEKPAGLLGLLLMGLTILIRFAVQTGNGLLAHSLSQPKQEEVKELDEHPASKQLKRTLKVLKTQNESQVRRLVKRG